MLPYLLSANLISSLIAICWLDPVVFKLGDEIRALNLPWYRYRYLPLSYYASVIKSLNKTQKVRYFGASGRHTVYW
jgi:hypothetical protein